MSSNLTLSKAHKLAIHDWQKAFNIARSSWQFRNLKTFEDLLVNVGYDRGSVQAYYPPEQLSKPVGFKDIESFFLSRKLEIDREYSWLDNPPAKPYKLPLPYEYEGITISEPVKKQREKKQSEDEEEQGDFEPLPSNKLQVCKLYPFQERAAAKLAFSIVNQNKRGQLLRAAVGTGKTYIVGRVAAYLKAIGYWKGKTFSPWPMVYVTKASIVEQTKRVLKEQFGLCTATECVVINIEQLRAQFGELMVGTETIVQQGEEHIVWKWKPFVHPLIIFWDECQILKNTDSQQSEIAQAFNVINDPPTIQIFFSATPFMRVCEAKCFAVATRLKSKFGIATTALTNDNWSQYAAHVAHPAEPEEYSPAAVERLMDSLNDYIVDVKGVRPQFNAFNNVQMIEFSTPEEAKFYHDAWARYEMMKQKIEGYELSGSQSRFLILAQFTIFRKAAELCRCEYFAAIMYQHMKDGKAPVLAVNFKGTIRRTVKILCEKYGVKRDDIALIWGGGKTQATKKQKAKKAITESAEVLEILRQSGITLDSLHLSDVEDYVDNDDGDNDKYRLGTQSLKQRQVEIDRFQSGKARFAMFTFKAGGVGLSLHHTDEMTKIKAERTRNNWAVPETIAAVPTRPRVCILAPTFSAIELVQGLGRCPRLTSLSDTVQTIVFYRGTIEERVAAIVSQKLRCLRKVVRTHESWESCIVGGVGKDETKLIGAVPDMDKDPVEDDDADNTSALFGDTADDEDEEVVEV